MLLAAIPVEVRRRDAPVRRQAAPVVRDV